MEAGTWILFRVWLSEDVIYKIISIPPPHPNSGADKGPQRMRFFLWLAFKQSLLTNSEHTMRGIGQRNSCTMCEHEFEDMAHVLHDCLAAKDDSGVSWSCLFGLIAWHIWKNRNLFIFQNISWPATEVAKVSISWARQFESYFSGYKSNVSNLNPVNIFDNTRVLLSIDDVVGILDGILILLNKGYRRTIIHTDNLEVVQALTDLGLEDLGITVLRRTQRIMKSEGQWKINHIPREQNSVADRLAKLSLNWKSTL
ncbi:hypothetical protein Godav_001046 [Gossypium davidsonii]|uniref:RNase H type-1 domain-containing protein n=1 Tax=Gossypium davidsonii TaxID=34287 RepID=A0A7J8T2J7_GOSDV|nr:hypothetical protein [Gossypium davidsonii]